MENSGDYCIKSFQNESGGSDGIMADGFDQSLAAKALSDLGDRRRLADELDKHVKKAEKELRQVQATSKTIYADWAQQRQVDTEFGIVIINVAKEVSNEAINGGHEGHWARQGGGCVKVPLKGPQPKKYSTFSKRK